MKLYSEQQIKNFMRNKDIVLDGEYIEINDSKLDRDLLIKSLKELQRNIKENKEDFQVYKKEGHTRKDKIRKK